MYSSTDRNRLDHRAEGYSDSSSATSSNGGQPSSSKSQSSSATPRMLANASPSAFVSNSNRQAAVQSSTNTSFHDPHQNSIDLIHNQFVFNHDLESPSTPSISQPDLQFEIPSNSQSTHHTVANHALRIHTASTINNNQPLNGHDSSPFIIDSTSFNQQSVHTNLQQHPSDLDCSIGLAAVSSVAGFSGSSRLANSQLPQLLPVNPPVKSQPPSSSRSDFDTHLVNPGNSGRNPAVDFKMELPHDDNIDIPPVGVPYVDSPQTPQPSRQPYFRDTSHNQQFAQNLSSPFQESSSMATYTNNSHATYGLTTSSPMAVTAAEHVGSVGYISSSGPNAPQTQAQAHSIPIASPNLSVNTNHARQRSMNSGRVLSSPQSFPAPPTIRSSSSHSRHASFKEQQVSSAIPTLPGQLARSSLDRSSFDHDPDFIPTIEIPHTPTTSHSTNNHDSHLPSSPSASTVKAQSTAISSTQTSGAAPPPPIPRRTQKRRSIGDWDFVRTIGAGSMGQVKLAKNRITGEFCAVKVIPRAHMEHRRHGHERTSKESDESKDIRTIREASIGKLLHHRYICQLYEMYPMTSHFYMLFEYVSGGQMLDYIISHGLLKEKQAREFGRSIASALDYCHRNSIIHRGKYLIDVFLLSLT